MKKEAVLIGAGKIGRGYMANIFNRAGYKMIFLDYSDVLVDTMRKQGYYTMFMKHRDFGNGDWTKERITNYEAYCTRTEHEKCVEVLSKANYATLHIYPGALKSLAELTADAIKERIRIGNEETLDMIFVINFLYADEIFTKEIKELLNEDEQKFMDEHIGIVYGLVRGNGPTPEDYMLEEDPIAVSCSDADYLPVDVDEMKGPFPEGVNLIPAHKVGNLVKYKVWGGNVSHCVNAFYGKYKGYEWGFQSEKDPYIFKCGNLSRREAYDALKGVEVDEEERKRYLGEQQDRPFRPDLVSTDVYDALNRVGADPIRKLGRNDRFIGPALLAIKAGKVPFFLARGAAYGFFFTNDADPAACEIQEYIKQNGIEKAVEKYCELDLSDRDENLLYQLIIGNYYEIIEKEPMELGYLR
ncbi:MAG: hypothetical protein IKM87_06535 [Clostridia bacterium]|nr:hypothetical protein [Clostridia bacterium]